jgi:hypothetical protein
LLIINRYFQITFVKKLKGKAATTLGKNFLTKLMTRELASSCNWDGVKKKAWKITQLFSVIIPKSICGENYGLSDYEKEVKAADERVHNNAYQDTFRKRKKEQKVCLSVLAVF